jgi:hypothetical protein
MRLIAVVNIGQDVQWNVNKHRICKLSITDCVFLEIFDFETWNWMDKIVRENRDIIC